MSLGTAAVALAIAVAMFGALLALRYVPVARSAGAIVIAAIMWAALWKSGVHPAIAGLAIGLVTSAYPP